MEHRNRTCAILLFLILTLALVTARPADAATLNKIFKSTQKTAIFNEINRSAKNETGSICVIRISGASKSQANSIAKEYKKKYLYYADNVLYIATITIDGKIQYGILFSPKSLKSVLSANAKRAASIKTLVKAAGISKKKTQKAKAAAIQKYLVKKLRYGRNEDPFTAIRTKSGNCTAYAELYRYMAHCAGLDVRSVYGRAKPHGKWLSHMWNRVKAGGKWYYVDACWCDTYSSRYGLTRTLWKDHKAIDVFG